MKLWTYHRDGFDPLRNRVVPEKSRYYQKYPKAYQKLYLELRTDQFVWCCTSVEPDNWKGCEEWELKVPCTKIFKIVDDLLWNVIIDENACPRALWTQIEEKISRTICDSEKWDSLIEQEVEKLRNPEGGPWKNLFLDDPRDVRATILLECPISSEWVIRKTKL